MEEYIRIDYKIETERAPDLFDGFEIRDDFVLVWKKDEVQKKEQHINKDIIEQIVVTNPLLFETGEK